MVLYLYKKKKGKKKMFDWRESAFFGFANEIEAARAIAKELAQLEDPNNLERQREICARHGLPLETMPDNIARFIEQEVRRH